MIVIPKRRGKIYKFFHSPTYKEAKSYFNAAAKLMTQIRYTINVSKLENKYPIHWNNYLKLETEWTAINQLFDLTYVRRYKQKWERQITRSFRWNAYDSALAILIELNVLHSALMESIKKMQSINKLIATKCSEKWTWQEQLLKLSEEVSEMMTELHHVDINDEHSVTSAIEEIVDVKIMLEQFLHNLNVSDYDVQQVTKAKVASLKKKIGMNQ